MFFRLLKFYFSVLSSSENNVLGICKIKYKTQTMFKYHEFMMNFYKKKIY
jgi:hypothetical protein